MKNPFVFLAVSLPILAACSPSGGASESADEASGPYKTATVEVGDVRDVVPAVGSLEAVGQVEVRAATTGTVTKVLVGLNDTVSEGQALAELRDPNEAADVRAARANADAAKARVDEANAAMRQIETELRNKSSLEKAGINSPAALEKLRLQLDAAKAAVERSEAEGRSAEALYDAAAAKAKLYVIASPSAGAVVGISLRSGQTVSPGDTAPAFLIGNTLDTMQVIATHCASTDSTFFDRTSPP
jgi:HlyD family secretion protein